jgi:hypothetical protein
VEAFLLISACLALLMGLGALVHGTLQQLGMMGRKRENTF